MTFNPTEGMKRADALLTQFREDAEGLGFTPYSAMMQARLFDLVAKAIDDGLAHGGLSVKQDELPLDDGHPMPNGSAEPYHWVQVGPGPDEYSVIEPVATAPEETIAIPSAPVVEAPARKKPGRPKGAKSAKKAKGKPGRPKKDRSAAAETVSATEAPVAAVSEAPVELPAVAAPEPSTEAPMSHG